MLLAHNFLFFFCIDSGDYVAVTELEVNFDPNTFQQTVSVVITDDDILESTEDFSASLILPNNQQGVQLEDSIINIMIIDDDCKFQYVFKL